MMLKNTIQMSRRFIFTRYFTIRKFVNLSRIFYEYETKKSSLKSYPCKLVIDPCNYCVLKCPLCPTGRGDEGRKKAMMGFRDCSRIIDETKDYLYEIDFYNWGEPLMNKDVFKMIRYAHDKGIMTRVSSNLNYFMEGFEKKLVGSGLDILVVSLDGTDKEAYSKYRRGGDFDKVLRNVKRIADEKRRQGSRTPRILWQFLIMKQNEGQLPKAKRMYKDYGFDGMKIEAVRTDISKEIFQSDEEKIKNSKEWLPENEKLSRFDYKKKEKKIKKKSCMFLWSMPVVNPDGSVSPCCAVYPERHDFGNAFKEGLMNIWNNERYVASRKIVSRKKSCINTVCSNCVKHGFIE